MNSILDIFDIPAAFLVFRKCRNLKNLKNYFYANDSNKLFENALIRSNNSEKLYKNPLISSIGQNLSIKLIFDGSLLGFIQQLLLQLFCDREELNGSKNC